MFICDVRLTILNYFALVIASTAIFMCTRLFVVGRIKVIYFVIILLLLQIKERIEYILCIR